MHAAVPTSTRNGTVADRVLGFFRFAWAPAARPIAAAASRRIDAGPLSAAGPRAALVPLTIGDPVQRSAADERFGPYLWTTQPRLSADGGTLGALTVRAASISGGRHYRSGHTREDAFAIGQATDGFVIAAVADGIGNAAARFSAVGAYVATVLSCDLVGSLLDRGSLVDARAACAEVAADMMPYARRFVDEPFTETDLATTLITAWVSPQGRYSVFMVGDGGVFELTDGTVTLIGPSQAGSSTATETMPASYRQVTEFSGRLTPGSALLLGTDGLSVPLSSPDVAAILGQGWRQPPTVLTFLYDLSFERRGEHDDRTGVGIWFDAERGTP